MIDNTELLIDTKKLENEIWEVSVRHIETGLSTSCSRYSSQIKNLESCKRQIEEMLVFYRFWEDREKSWWSDELTVWLPFYKIEDFVSLIGEDYFCEGDIQVVIMGEYIAFDLVPYCEYLCIDAELLLKKEN